MISDFDIIEEKPVTLTKVRDILNTIEEKNLEQKKALKNAKSFARLKLEDAEKLSGELKAFDMRKLKDQHIAKIVDVLPKDKDDLKLVLEDSKTAFNDEELQKILDLVSNYK